MNIRDNKSIPQEVECFLLDYEITLELNKDMNDSIELVVLTNTDVFEGVLLYWKDNTPVIQVLTWNSWYNELPEIFGLAKRR